MVSMTIASWNSPRPVTRKDPATRFFQPQADVLPLLVNEPLASLREVTKSPSSGPRRVVGAEDHRDGRLVDAERRQRRRMFAVGDRVADLDLLDAGDGDDVAGLGGVDPDALEPSQVETCVIFTASARRRRGRAHTAPLRAAAS
jgi:hypothetical protein